MVAAGPARQDGPADAGPVMRLIALLVVLVLAGLFVGRGQGLLAPKPGPAATPGASLRQVERAAEAAGQADRRRLDAAMQGLR